MVPSLVAVTGVASVVLVEGAPASRNSSSVGDSSSGASAASRVTTAFLCRAASARIFMMTMLATAMTTRITSCFILATLRGHRRNRRGPANRWIGAPGSLRPVEGDLFSDAAGRALKDAAPLAERLRPADLDAVVGQQHLLDAGRPLRRLVESGGLRSLVLWGPPGTGKTTLARLIATSGGSAFEMLSAVSASVKDIRQVAEDATRRIGERSESTVLFLDEIHRFSKSQQDALLPHVESGLLTLIGATTESPWATINRPLLSRCTVFQLEPLDEAASAELLRRGLDELGATISPDAGTQLMEAVTGDGRRLLSAVEIAAQLSGGTITVDHVSDALGAGAAHYDRGDHYDAASAFIKHLRAGDEVQAMAWLHHMLDGGEDPRFVARRMVIFASEDIGVADRGALLLADAAARAVDFVGMPEARYALGHAVLALARAPHSREVGERLAAAAATILEQPQTDDADASH